MRSPYYFLNLGKESTLENLVETYQHLINILCKQGIIVNSGVLPNAELPALLLRLLPVVLPRLLPVLLIRLPVLLALMRLATLLVRLSIAEPVAEADFESNALIADPAASTFDDAPSSFDLPICRKESERPKINSLSTRLTI